ncbi:MAG: SMI1/KNR4 family protein [Pirellulales bacterium]|nr:SMI1/KNR4 family protein [Pirellulales bacterium]
MGAERFWEPWTVKQLGYQVPDTVSWEDIRAWETAFGVELPISLSQALVAQNGGRLLRTSIDILPLQCFITLEQGEWPELLRKECPSPSDQACLILVGYLPGGRAILDYRLLREPQVRNIDPMMDGELRGVYRSFDEVVRLMSRT